ncbi:MAG: glycerol-3-phosphate acyltransferase [Ilumatobacteraceae bacterium]
MRSRSFLAAAAIGYLVGTFPTADLVARRVSAGRVDLRRSGSGNPGTLNAANVLGAKAGVAVLVGDIGKGAVASVVGGAIAGPVGAHVAGSAGVIGHCHPVWNGFRGGKGVAASIGQCLVTFPAYFPIDLAVGAATAAMPWWRRRRLRGDDGVVGVLGRRWRRVVATHGATGGDRAPRLHSRSPPR